MYRMIDRFKLIFLAVFAIASAGMFIYEFGWRRPIHECEVERRGWWDPDTRVCAKPVLISDITGRTLDDKAAEAAARKAIGRAAVKP